MKYSFILLFITFIASTVLSACDVLTDTSTTEDLRVVIIRHGEKPKEGNNLNCQGQNRALQLAEVLHQKFKQPDFIYVPALDADKSTSHSRMFQTITPFAVKYNLTINSKYDEKDFEKVAKSVLQKKGTVLMVWSHKAIPKLAKALGVKDAPQWQDEDFDSIWVLNFQHHKSTLTFDKEDLNPANQCSY